MASVEARNKRLPKLPAPLEQKVQELAEAMVVEQVTDARRVAALELANKLLLTVTNLLKHATDGAVIPGTAAPSVAPAAARPVPKGPLCVLCGGKGIWQDKTAKLAPGTKPPWYCNVHGAAAAQEQRAEVVGAGLLQALQNAKPIDDTALPQ